MNEPFDILGITFQTNLDEIEKLKFDKKKTKNLKSQRVFYKEIFGTTMIKLQET